MVSRIEFAYQKKLFLLLLIFSWSIIACFMGFQYMREKQFKQEMLSAQLQLYNQHLVHIIDQGLPYKEYMDSNEKPFEDLRISVITLQGAVIYDNILPADSLDNHIMRPEVAQALVSGSGYHIGRHSASDGRLYFYSATKGERAIVRTAIPYSASLMELLEADMAFFYIMIAASIIMSIVTFFVARRLAMQEEKEKSRIKREITNNINHELKTPVASIQVCLETLLSGMRLSEDKRMELIERCYTNNDRLRKLLNEVSLITRMEEGSQLISKEEIVLNDILGDISDEVGILPEGERMTVYSEFKERVVITGNLQLIGSIFRNLIENAITYSGGKSIYIKLLDSDREQCRICVEDDGCGVEQEHLPHLFERFYRVDKGRSRKMGGTGLGLAIVKHAVQFHGGTIFVSNRNGGGLRFEFTLKRK